VLPFWRRPISIHVDDESQQLIVKNNLLGVVILDRCKAIFPHLEMLSVRIPLGDEYSIQHYVIMFVGDGCFFPDTAVSSTNKTNRYNIAEILFNMTLNTRTLTPKLHLFCMSPKRSTAAFFIFYGTVMSKRDC
jgi:hypothetical protein